jgi:hypothetical protein
VLIVMQHHFARSLTLAAATSSFTLMMLLPVPQAAHTVALALLAALLGAGKTTTA